jgi:hypothetical protein
METLEINKMLPQDSLPSLQLALCGRDDPQDGGRPRRCLCTPKHIKPWGGWNLDRDSLSWLKIYRIIYNFREVTSGRKS